MKRQEQVAPGVYRYSTGQIVTSDLPLFLSECAYHSHHTSRKLNFMLNNIRHVVDNRMPWRGQLARAYAQYKTAQKRHRAN